VVKQKNYAVLDQILADGAAALAVEYGPEYERITVKTLS